MANGQWLKARKRAFKLFSLFYQLVQTLVDACAEVTQLVDGAAIATLYVSACSDKTPEESHIVPSKNKHEWECYQIAQCPPYISKDCQNYEWNEKAYRYRYEYAYAHMER